MFCLDCKYINNILCIPFFNLINLHILINIHNITYIVITCFTVPINNCTVIFLYKQYAVVVENEWYCEMCIIYKNVHCL